LGAKWPIGTQLVYFQQLCSKRIMLKLKKNLVITEKGCIFAASKQLTKLNYCLTKN
jgi:hypothetical protein